MRKSLLFASVAGLLVLAGCDWVDPSEWGAMQRFKEPYSTTEKLSSGGRVMLETFNGPIEIRGWDREEVSLEIVKYASRQEVLDQMDIDVAADGNSLRVRVRRPQSNCNCGASITARVPRKIILEEARTSNGSVTLEALEGSGKVTTSNGKVQAWDVKGEWAARTSNGAVELDKVSGAMTARTSNGRIRLSGLRGSADVETSNGPIDAEIAEPQEGAGQVFRSSNGSISVKLDRWSRNPLRITTSNASITLALPEGVNADVRASTSNGRVSSDYEVAARDFRKNRLEGRLGAGGERIELTSSNGSIRIVRR